MAKLIFTKGGVLMASDDRDAYCPICGGLIGGVSLPLTFGAPESRPDCWQPFMHMVPPYITERPLEALRWRGYA